MKPAKPRGTFRSFKDLKALLDIPSLPVVRNPANGPPKVQQGKPDPVKEQQLFDEAMANVTPISRSGCIESDSQKRVPEGPEDNPDAAALWQLENLVKHGEGFVLADTAEYIEGTGHRVNPEITRRLHRGDFSIQAHIDLHGLSVEDAHAAFEVLLKDSIVTGKRAVLIVHGRGLSSPDKPVLKTRLIKWLTTGPWRKWVMAFSSARACDGGTGATYVLLRARPMTKRFRKKTKKQEVDGGKTD
ncbi:MAG: Smr/MutS family protein [Pseudomonadota bacterium]